MSVIGISRFAEMACILEALVSNADVAQLVQRAIKEVRKNDAFVSFYEP